MSELTALQSMYSRIKINAGLHWLEIERSNSQAPIIP
jgi:hypothetical protein